MTSEIASVRLLRRADISIGHLVERGISAEQVAKIHRYSKVLFTHSEV